MICILPSPSDDMVSPLRKTGISGSALQSYPGDWKNGQPGLSDPAITLAQEYSRVIHKFFQIQNVRSDT